MNCPACGAPVEAATSICPICDFILDASFLEGASEGAVGAPDPSDRTLPRARMPEPAGVTGAAPATGPARATASRPAIGRSATSGSRGTSDDAVADDRTMLRPAPAPPTLAREASGAAVADAHTTLRPAPTSAGAGVPSSAPSIVRRPTSAGAGVSRSAPPAVADAHTTLGAAPAPRTGARKAPRALDDAALDGATPPRGQRMPEAPSRQVSAPRGKVDYAALAREYGDDAPSTSSPPPSRPERMTTPDEAFEEFRQFFAGLSRSDKLTLIGAFLILLTAFLPWKVTAAEGDVLGMFSLGLVAAGLAAAAIATITLRTSRRAAGMNPVLPWVFQLAAVSAAVLWCLVFIKVSWDGTPAKSLDGNILVATSRPEAGVYIALVSAIVALAGTLGGLRDHGDAQR